MAPKTKLPEFPDPEKDELAQAARHSYPVVLPLAEIEGVTFGLELLKNASHIFIRPAQEHLSQEHHSNEDVNQYEIIDASCGRIYYAWETNVEGVGSDRTYVLKIVDYDSRPVLQVKRTVGCLSCCLTAFNCFGTTGSLVEVTTPDGERIGEVIQKYNGWRPKFMVVNAFEKTTMAVLGPSGGDCCYRCNLLADSTFDVIGKQSIRIASIHSGSEDPMARKCQETFGIRLFTEMTAEDKAILLGGVFSLNFMYFEKHRKTPTSESHVLDNMEAARKQAHKRDMDQLGIVESKKSSQVAVAETRSKSNRTEEPGNSMHDSAGDKRGSLIEDNKHPLINQRRFLVTE